MDLHTRLRKLLDERGTSPPRVADAIGESASTVARWFKGPHKPRLDQAVKLAAHFGVSLGELAGVEDPLSPDEQEVLRIVRLLGHDKALARLLAIDPPGHDGGGPHRGERYRVEFLEGGEAEPVSPAPGPRRRSQ